jgi:hypothetical protein
VGFRWLIVASACAAIGLWSERPRAQDSPSPDRLHAPLDELLDLYVRDGLVYYGALRADRGRLDRYVEALDSRATISAYETWGTEARAAFWVNAYNAFVLRTVVDAYPIRGRAPDYPPESVRQIPGAFERLTHRAAGRTVTLDDIDTRILSEFADPRLYLALGRGAVGSPRLRSEAFTAGRLASQLAGVAAECPTRAQCVLVESSANRVSVTPVIGWHEAAFTAKYAADVGPFASRSPIERAVLAFVGPHLLETERVFLERNRFAVTYSEFDWRLNDLTGR